MRYIKTVVGCACAVLCGCLQTEGKWRDGDENPEAAGAAAEVATVPVKPADKTVPAPESDMASKDKTADIARSAAEWSDDLRDAVGMPKTNDQEKEARCQAIAKALGTRGVEYLMGNGRLCSGDALRLAGAISGGKPGVRVMAAWLQGQDLRTCVIAGLKAMDGDVAAKAGVMRCAGCTTLEELADKVIATEESRARIATECMGAQAIAQGPNLTPRQLESNGYNMLCNYVSSGLASAEKMLKSKDKPAAQNGVKFVADHIGAGVRELGDPLYKAWKKSKPPKWPEAYGVDEAPAEDNDQVKAYRALVQLM